MKKLDSDMVKSFWEFMRVHYNFHVLKKSDSRGMILIGEALDSMGIQDADTFLSRYTTTIGASIYVPFDIGAGSYDNLLSQIETCVHECVHIEQFRKARAAFIARYLGNTADRADYEAEAYLTNIEMHFFLTGKLLNPRSLASNLIEYGCSDVDVSVVAKKLSMGADLVKDGAMISGPTLTAVKWLQSKGLLGPL